MQSNRFIVCILSFVFCSFFSCSVHASRSEEIIAEINRIEKEWNSGVQRLSVINNEIDNAENTDELEQEAASIQRKLRNFKPQLNRLKSERIKAEEYEASIFYIDNKCLYLRDSDPDPWYSGVKSVVGTKAWSRYNEWREPGYEIASKKYAVDSLCVKLQSQLQTVKRTRADYVAELGKYQKELRNLKQAYRIDTLGQNTPREIRYIIELMQQRDAYVSKLAEIESVTTKGIQDTLYMSNQLSGAKGMAKVIENAKALSNDVEALFKKYGKYTENLGINSEMLNFKKPEQIWQIYK